TRSHGGMSREQRRRSTCAGKPVPGVGGSGYSSADASTARSSQRPRIVSMTMSNKPVMEDFTESTQPYSLFGEWLEDAKQSEPNDPNAVALSTVDPDGMPNVRIVLLKGYDTRGFVFYTNYESTKGREILASMKAAMCFHW